MADLLETIRQFLNAPLAPGKPSLNTLIGLAQAGHLHANFDREQGGQNVDSKKPDKRKPRILRPGAIILPNLDIDEDPASPRARFTKDELDSIVDDKVNDGDDVDDLTVFKVAEPSPIAGDAVKIIMKVDPNDAKRIRIWEIPKGKTAQDGVVRIGPGTNQHTILDVSGFTAFPSRGWEDEFIIEALTLAGDPKLPAPSSKAPTPPGKHRSPAPDTIGGSQSNPTVNDSDTGKSIYDTEKRFDAPGTPEARAVGDVWIELIHENLGGPVADLKDIGLFTIAPWIMTWNTLECQRIYVAYLTPETRPRTGGAIFERALTFENHAMVWDLQNGCSAAGLGSAPDPDTTQPIPTNSPSDITDPADVPYYVIDGANVLDDPAARTSMDRWVQDEFEIGYCAAPHNSLHVVLHNKRNRGLSKFVEEEMAHASLGVFNGLAGRARDGQDFGGNLEVSPPVASATPALPRTVGRFVAGPTTKEHDRPAPFGKIVIGDCTPRPCHAEFHQFLLAQKVQPVLPLDTSWLLVGHVDEFLSFVRSNDSKQFKLLFASVSLLTTILREVKAVDETATMHAGKFDAPTGRYEYDEHFVDEWLTGLGNVLTYSEKVETQKLNPIQERLRVGLDLAEEDILPIPTYFVPPINRNAPFGSRDNQTIARNVGSVNMQIVNDHLMIPRPFGPRLEPTKAEQALDAILKKFFDSSPVSAPAKSMPSPSEHFVWARPGEKLEQISMYFARPAPASGHGPKEPRRQLMAKIRNPRVRLHPDYQAAVNQLMDDIRNHPDNKNAPTPIDTVAPPPDRVFTEWMRLTIPDNTVDVIEAYFKSLLEEIGNAVHFIDDFESYHAQMGEVHCGTNAKRQPPEEDGSFSDLWWDSGNYDPDYDTSYEPNR